MSSPLRVPGGSERRYAATDRRGPFASTLTRTSTETALGGSGASRRTDPPSMWAGIVKLSIGCGYHEDATTMAHARGTKGYWHNGRRQRTGHGAYSARSFVPRGHRRFTAEVVRLATSPSAPERPGRGPLGVETAEITPDAGDEKLELPDQLTLNRGIDPGASRKQARLRSPMARGVGAQELVSCNRSTSHNLPPMHPGSLRCSSLHMLDIRPPRRLALRAPRRRLMRRTSVTGH